MNFADDNIMPHCRKVGMPVILWKVLEKSLCVPVSCWQKDVCVGGVDLDWDSVWYEPNAVWRGELGVQPCMCQVGRQAGGSDAQ